MKLKQLDKQMFLKIMFIIVELAFIVFHSYPADYIPVRVHIFIREVPGLYFSVVILYLRGFPLLFLANA